MQSEAEPCGRARKAASLTRACASWSPSPRPPPGRLPHSRAGTPGSAEGPRRLVRRVPAGGPRQSRWHAHPMGKGQDDALPAQPDQLSRPASVGRGSGPGEGMGGPCPTAPPAALPHSGPRMLRPNPGLLRARKEPQGPGPLAADGLSGEGPHTAATLFPGMRRPVVRGDHSSPGGWATGSMTLDTECFR